MEIVTAIFLPVSGRIAARREAGGKVWTGRERPESQGRQLAVAVQPELLDTFYSVRGKVNMSVDLS
ncbi:MAG: hypothetical protein FWF31_07430 [Desulfobulbus sp.]|nr:hypothetical protein [Desulfobulbus sp.]